MVDAVLEKWNCVSERTGAISCLRSGINREICVTRRVARFCHCSHDRIYAEGPGLTLHFHSINELEGVGLLNESGGSLADEKITAIIFG